ncbi:MAG: hypothetical protein NE327_04305 [Lentisphaeraceae bacterium]|nr:hypothetical protein [Lentisphaeraceae bacterium]
MSKPFSQQELTKAGEGDLKTLSELDKRGFIIGPEESPENYSERLKVFEKNLNEMGSELKEKNALTVEDLTFPAEEKIPIESFNPAGKITEDLYDFKINWVPGFFVTPSFGILFGGCAYSFAPEFFSLFIIRNSFKKKKKWLFYERDELMSHELCHVARFAMGSHKYEEQFAYQTSTSSFRKNYGCMMRSAWETYIIMILLFGMLATQISLITFKGDWLTSRTIIENPVHWFYAALFGFVAYLVLRQKKQNKGFAKTLDLLSTLTTKPKALAFRLSDPELDKLSQMNSIDKESFKKLILSTSGEHRFEILKSRFFDK